jgi:serine protease Do
MSMWCRFALLTVAAVLVPSAAQATDPLREVAEQVNTKVVKVYGAGGFAKVGHYGSGIIVSPEGHILTVANHLLDTESLVVHLYDGRRMPARVIAVEPELDAALIKIVPPGKKIDEPTRLDLPFYDITEAAKRPRAQPGDWVLAFSNAFEASSFDEPVTMQRGVVAAHTKLHARNRLIEFRYTGDVYVVDSITNNEGAAGGALTDRKGNLLGIVGRELQNAQSETMINYAIPVGASVEVTVAVKGERKTETRSIPDFVAHGMKGEYRAVKRDRVDDRDGGGFAGIVFVPNVLERTPAYVESIVPGSPAEGKLRPDDLISFVDGEPVPSIKAFEEYRRTRTKPNGSIRVEFVRDGTFHTIELILAAPPMLPEPSPAKK